MDDIKIRLALDGADQVQAGATRAAQGLEKLGGAGAKAGQQAKVSAHELQAVSMQLQDLFVQIQGGGAPLTALIQQTSGLSSQLGGFGNAARALLGIFTPMVVAVGAVVAGVGALGLAYAKGAKEGDAYARALILSGNAAGQTVGQLQALAQAQSQVVGTQGAAADALAKLASTGQVSAQVLGQAGEAAVRFSRVGGDIDATVKKFADLGKDPLKALISLNEAENFLTAATYKQVKALTEQGRMAEAAAVAQSAYASAVNGRAKELEANLGTLEKAWKDVGDWAANAWDKMLNIGRPATLQDQLKDVQAQIQAAQEKIAKAQSGEMKAGRPFLDTDRIAAAQMRLVETLKAKAATLEENIRLEGSMAQNEAERARGVKAMIKADEDAAKVSDNGIADLRAKIKETRELIVLLGTQGSVIRELNRGEEAANKLREQMADAKTAAVRASLAQKLALAEEWAAELRVADGLKQARTEYEKYLETLKQDAAATNAQAAAQEAANATFGQGKVAVEQYRLGLLQAERESATNTERVDLVALKGIEDKISEQKRYVEALRAGEIKGIYADAQKFSDEAQAAGIAADANTSLAAALQQVAIARLKDGQAKALAAGRKDEAADLAKEIAARETLAAAISKSDAAKSLKDFLDPKRADDFGTALGKAFEGAVSSLAKMNNLFDQQRELALAVAKATADNGTANGSDPAKRAAEQLRINERAQRSQIGLYASMAGAAKGFFSEGTRGYKALEAAETAFRVVQLASDLQKGMSAAAVAVASQGQGDPYSAWARMAAMAAAMAALGFAVSGGGGGSAPPPSNTGAGTVLGDSSKPSESIANALDQLRDNSSIELVYTQRMLAQLVTLNDNISGLASMVVRTGTLDASTAGISLAKGPSTGDLVKNYAAIGAVVGSILPGFGTVLGAAAGALTGLVDSTLGKAVPVIGKILGGIWGGKQSVEGSGLYMGATTLAQAMAGTGSLQTYADIKTKGGWFSSDKYSTQFSAADAGLQDQFAKIFASMYGALDAAAGPLGQSTDAFESKLKGFVLNIGKIDLKDLTGDKLQEKLQNVLGAEADRLAASVLPGLVEFQKIGEGYFETVVRVASGVETAQAALGRLGVTAIEFGDVARKQGDVAAEIVRQSITAFETVGGALSSVGNLIDGLNGDAADIAGAYRSLVDVRDVMQAIGTSGNALTAALLQGADGLDSLKSSLDTYLGGAFFTDQERAAASMQMLQKQFARIGIEAVPQSYAAFRQLVEGIDTSTAAGQKLYGEVLGLAGAFEAAQKAAEQAGTASGRLPEILKSQATERDGLLVDLLRAQGDTVAANALKRSQDLAVLLKGLGDAEAEAATAGYDHNAALRDQVAAAQQASQALVSFKGQMSTLANTRFDLETQILTLQGNAAEVARRTRERDLAKITEGMTAEQAAQAAAAYDYNTVLRDQAAAAQQASEALTSFKSQMNDLANTRFDLETQLLALQGNADEVARRTRERDLAKITEGMTADRAAQAAAAYDYNTSLKKQLDDLTASQQAQQEASRAAQQAADEAVRSAEQLRDAWKGVSDSLLDAAKDILGLNVPASQQTVAQAWAQFATSTGQARAGDQEAAKLLPQLGRTVVEMVSNTATSRAELERARAQVAASLQGTAGVLGGLFGFSTQSSSTAVDVSALLAQVAATAPITSLAATQQQSASAYAAQDNMAALVVEVKALRAEVQALKDPANRTAAATERARDLITQVTDNGNAMQVQQA